MIKVLFMIHDLSFGGAEKVLVNLVNNLDKTRFDITVFALFDGGINKNYLNDNIHYKYLFNKTFKGNSRLFKLFTPKHLHNWIIKDKYDIEVSYLEGPSARIISGCNYNAKPISWIHIEQKNKKNASRAFRNYNESLQCYMKFHKTICVSESVKKDYESLYKLKNPIDVIYNTNETSQIIKLSNEKIDFNFDENLINIIGVGKIVPNKGFDRLAKITKKLIDEGYLLHVYILGVGTMQKSIEKYLDDNKIRDFYTFLGYQTNPYKYLSKADLFVCASYAKGFSTATTESLIVGTPVVTTRVSGMEEMLGSNNEYGVITDNNDEALYLGIKDMITKESRLDYYKQKAKERGKDFNKEKTVKAVDDMFMKLIND